MAGGKKLIGELTSTGQTSLPQHNRPGTLHHSTLHQKNAKHTYYSPFPALTPSTKLRIPPGSTTSLTRTHPPTAAIITPATGDLRHLPRQKPDIIRLMTPPAKPTFCPHCHSPKIVKKGSRRNLYRVIPQYQGKACYKYFSAAAITKVKYPPRLIMQAITYYNLGHSQTEVASLLASKHRTRVPRRTISEWIKRYRSVCTYSRLRDQAIKPSSVINQITSFTHTRWSISRPTSLSIIEPSWSFCKPTFRTGPWPGCAHT